MVVAPTTAATTAGAWARASSTTLLHSVNTSKRVLIANLTPVSDSKEPSNGCSTTRAALVTTSAVTMKPPQEDRTSQFSLAISGATPNSPAQAAATMKTAVRKRPAKLGLGGRRRLGGRLVTQGLETGRSFMNRQDETRQ